MKNINDVYKIVVDRFNDCELRRGLLEALFLIDELKIKEKYKKQIALNILNELNEEDGTEYIHYNGMIEKVLL